MWPFAAPEIQQVPRALLLGLEQPHILDCDDRLVSEDCYQFDFVVREGFDPVTSQRDHTDCLALAHQRHADHRAHATYFGVPLLLIERIVPRVVDPRDLSCKRSPSNHRSVTGQNNRLPLDLEISRHSAVASGKSICPMLLPIDHSLFGAAEPHSGFHDALQDRLQLEIGAADDAQNFGRCPLLLSRRA
jgi:hypothetical protein